MSDEEILEKLRKLPVEKKSEIEQLIDVTLGLEKAGETKREFGWAKGKIKILPGFDDPIEGMEEYYK